MQPKFIAISPFLILAAIAFSHHALALGKEVPMSPSGHPLFDARNQNNYYKAGTQDNPNCGSSVHLGSGPDGGVYATCLSGGQVIELDPKPTGGTDGGTGGRKIIRKQQP